MQSIGRESSGSPEFVDDSFSNDPLKHELHGQLARIFSVLGIPTREELSWASDAAARLTPTPLPDCVIARPACVIVQPAWGIALPDCVIACLSGLIA